MLDTKKATEKRKMESYERAGVGLLRRRPLRGGQSWRAEYRGEAALWLQVQGGRVSQTGVTGAGL